MSQAAASLQAGPVVAGPGARSLTSAVYQQLRLDIIGCRLAQNEKLHLARLQERFGVSLSVVREALSRLVADGLITTEAQRGFRVSPVSKKDLIDVTQTRIRIEGMALQLAIARGDEHWLRALQASYDQLHALDFPMQTEAWTRCHADFHRVLLQPCDSVWLLRFRDLLFEQSERYRHLFSKLAEQRETGTQRDLRAEHRELLESALARDAERARAAVDTHFSNTMTAVLAVTHID